MENIRLAFQGIWGHKLRSFLTMLGIIIGIASIITIVSTIKGTSEQIKQNLIGSGSNVVTVQLYQGSSAYDMSYNDVPAEVRVIPESRRAELEALQGVDRVSFYTQRQWSSNITAGTASFDGSCYGVDMAFFQVMSYEVTYGRNFQQSDFDNYRKVMILDKKAAATLFRQTYPVGKSVEINGEPYTVIGVVEPIEQFQPVINSMEDYQMYVDTSGGAVYIPSAVWPVSYKFDEPQNAVIRADSTDNMSSAGNAAAEVMNQGIDTNSSKFKYKADDVMQQVRNMQKLSESTNTQLIWIASISLLVGGIGVMNIMLVSVTERTSEIGLKKAIGARKKVILFQFLTEAAMLTSIGGIIGVIVGIVLSKVVSKLSGAPTAISIPAIIGSVIFSMLIGVIFGLLPSVKAADLNPIDALRSE